jgi:hypothetical protein
MEGHMSLIKSWWQNIYSILNIECSMKFSKFFINIYATICDFGPSVNLSLPIAHEGEPKLFLIGMHICSRLNVDLDWHSDFFTGFRVEVTKHPVCGGFDFCVGILGLELNIRWSNWKGKKS